MPDSTRFCIEQDLESIRMKCKEYVLSHQNYPEGILLTDLGILPFMSSRPWKGIASKLSKFLRIDSDFDCYVYDGANDGDLKVRVHPTKHTLSPRRPSDQDSDLTSQTIPAERTLFPQIKGDQDEHMEKLSSLNDLRSRCKKFVKENQNLPEGITHALLLRIFFQS